MDLSLTSSQLRIQPLSRDFAQNRGAPMAREMDEKGEMPLSLLGEMAASGLLGGPLPVEFGGGGWDAVSLAVCYEELGRADSSVRGFMTVHTSLVAHLALVFANADRSLKHKGICAFLVPTDTLGFRREKMKGKELGHRASDHAHIHFENMRVPKSALLGAPGEGFRVAMSALDHGRLGAAAEI